MENEDNPSAVLKINLEMVCVSLHARNSLLGFVLVVTSAMLPLK